MNTSGFEDQVIWDTSRTIKENVTYSLCSILASLIQHYTSFNIAQTAALLLPQQIWTHGFYITRSKILLWILLALGYLNEWLAYFLILLCFSMVTACPVNVSICQMKHYAQSLLRCSVALNNSALVWRLARSQSVYSESGPAVHFFLRVTVHTL